MLVERVSSKYPEICSWEKLAFFLGRESRLLADKQVVTHEAQFQLGQMGFSWSEWRELRQVADMAVNLFHTDQECSVDDALTQLDSYPMPDDLQHTRSTVKKALQFIMKESMPA